MILGWQPLVLSYPHTGLAIQQSGLPKLRCNFRRGITVESTKYAHVIASLQPEIAQEVRDLLVNPPTNNPYTELKEELIRRTSQSKQRRLQQLLITEELGDRKPSQLLG